MDSIKQFMHTLSERYCLTQGREAHTEELIREFVAAERDKAVQAYRSAAENVKAAAQQVSEGLTPGKAE